MALLITLTLIGCFPSCHVTIYALHNETVIGLNNHSWRVYELVTFKFECFWKFICAPTTQPVNQSSCRPILPSRFLNTAESKHQYMKRLELKRSCQACALSPYHRLRLVCFVHVVNVLCQLSTAPSLSPGSISDDAIRLSILTRFAR